MNDYAEVELIDPVTGSNITINTTVTIPYSVKATLEIHLEHWLSWVQSIPGVEPEMVQIDEDVFFTQKGWGGTISVNNCIVQELTVGAKFAVDAEVSEAGVRTASINAMQN